MKMKLLILTLLVLPLVSFAETVTYYMEADETIEEVRADFAKKYNVPADSLWIYDLENDPRKLFIEVPNKSATTTATNSVDLSKLEAKITILETENSQLKTKISLLEQIISLLKTIIGLK